MGRKYEMRQLTDGSREHVLSEDCWCEPTILRYGAEPVYDDAGNLVSVDDPEDEDV